MKSAISFDLPVGAMSIKFEGPNEIMQVFFESLKDQTIGVKVTTASLQPFVIEMDPKSTMGQVCVTPDMFDVSIQVETSRDPH